jgi:hypothetical protein
MESLCVYSLEPLTFRWVSLWDGQIYRNKTMEYLVFQSRITSAPFPAIIIRYCRLENIYWLHPKSSAVTAFIVLI